MVQISTIDNLAGFELLATTDTMAIALPRSVPLNVNRFAEKMAAILNRHDICIHVPADVDVRPVLSQGLEVFHDGEEKDFIVGDLTLQVDEMRKLSRTGQVYVDIKSYLGTSFTERPHKDAFMALFSPQDIEYCKEIAKTQGMKKGWQEARNIFLEKFGEEYRFITAYSGEQMRVYEDQKCTIRDFTQKGLGFIAGLERDELPSPAAEVPEGGAIIGFKPQILLHGSPKVETDKPRLVAVVRPAFQYLQ